MEESASFSDGKGTLLTTEAADILLPTDNPPFFNDSPFLWTNYDRKAFFYIGRTMEPSWLSMLGSLSESS